MELRPGLRIQRYNLQAMVGSGASGEVWRALDGERNVAIKFVKSDDLRHLVALEREVAALEKIEHPNIPMLFDHDLNASRPYLVMQYVPDPTCDGAVATGEILWIRLDQRLEALNTIATAVQAVHYAGFIHRDIKPGNISGLTNPFLLDFSLACERGQTVDPNTGTGIYMPPLGQSPDVLGDYYAFVITAYEMIFGRHPLYTPQTIGKTVAETRAMTAAKLDSGLWRWPSKIPLGELPGDLHGVNLTDLDTIFARGLGSKPDRYLNILTFVDDLRIAITAIGNLPYVHTPSPPPNLNPIPTEAAYTDHEVSVAFQPTNPDRLRPNRPRWLWLLGAAFIVAFLVVLLAAGRGSL